MVNSKEFADTIFTVGGSVLYAHKTIIEVRCPTLFAVNLKDRPSKKGNISFYKIDDKLFDETTLYVILYYLYTDTVQFSNIGPIDVVMLIKAAEIYELHRLIWLCERYLVYVITDGMFFDIGFSCILFAFIDLFFTLLKASHNMNVARAKNICMEYGKSAFTTLINKREEVHTLGIELFREFVVFTHVGGVEVEDPKSKTLEPTIQQDMKKVYKDRHHCDGTFSFGNETVDCHRSILLAQSEKLLRILKPEGQDQSTLSLPKDYTMSAAAFESALAFIYYRDTSFNSAHAAEIIPFAREFELAPLYTECESKIKSGITIESVIPILSLCYNKDLEKFVKKDMLGPCLNFITNNFSKVDFTSLKKKTPKMAADILRLVKKQITIGKWTPKQNVNESNASSDLESTETTSKGSRRMEKTDSKASVDTSEPKGKEKEEKGDANEPTEKVSTPTNEETATVEKEKVEEKVSTPKAKRKDGEKRDSSKKGHERKESSGKKKKSK